MVWKKVRAFCVIFSSILAISMISYWISGENYRNNELLHILFECLASVGLLYYLKVEDIDQVLLPNKQDLLRLLVIFIVYKIWSNFYTSFFSLSSGSTEQIHSILALGWTISYRLHICVFGPLQEEIFCRGLLQRAFFKNSWFGLIISSAIFSFAHVPKDVLSVLFYGISGVLIGYSYKKSEKILVPTLLHMLVNSFIMLFSI